MARVCDVCGKESNVTTNIVTDYGTRQLDLCTNHINDWFNSKENDSEWISKKEACKEVERNAQPLRESWWKREREIADKWLKSNGLQ